MAMKERNFCWDKGVTFFHGVATSKLPTLQQTTAPSILMLATLITRSGPHKKTWESTSSFSGNQSDRRRTKQGNRGETTKIGTFRYESVKE